jgi:hypothetical protein
MEEAGHLLTKQVVHRNTDKNHVASRYREQQTEFSQPPDKDVRHRPRTHAQRFQGALVLNVMVTATRDTAQVARPSDISVWRSGTHAGKSRWRYFRDNPSF